MVFAAKGETGRLELASAPFLNRPIQETASSTVTLPIFLPAFAPEARAGFALERALLDECLHEAADLLDLADEVAARVDDVGVDVAVRAGAGDFRLQRQTSGKFGSVIQSCA